MFNLKAATLHNEMQKLQKFDMSKKNLARLKSYSYCTIYASELAVEDINGEKL